jgi:PleD family two-component response regulator
LPPHDVTVSCGVAEWSQDQTADDLPQTADRSLYDAKRAHQSATAAPR